MNTENPSSFEELVDSINPQIYQALKLAVEIGKWDSGDSLTKEQVEHCLQAIIAYETKHIEPENRVGYIEKKPGDAEDRIRPVQPDTISSDRTGPDLQ